MYSYYISQIKQNINDSKKLHELKDDAEKSYYSKKLTIEQYAYLIGYINGILDSKVYGGNR